MRITRFQSLLVSNLSSCFAHEIRDLRILQRYATHHRTGVCVVDIGCAAEGEGEAAAFQVVAERSEDAFDFAVIGVAGDAHLDGELADADEVLGRAVGEVCRILFRSEVVGGPQAVQVEITIAVARAELGLALVLRIDTVHVVAFFAIHVQDGLDLSIEVDTVVHGGDGI